MVVSHTAAEIKGIERDYTRTDASPVNIFTPEQIEAHCKHLENLSGVVRAKGRLLIDSALIIRQLQNQSRGVRLLNPVEFEVF